MYIFEPPSPPKKNNNKTKRTVDRLVYCLKSSGKYLIIWFSNLFTLSIPDESYSCAPNWISTFLCHAYS